MILLYNATFMEFNFDNCLQYYNIVSNVISSHIVWSVKQMLMLRKEAVLFSKNGKDQGLATQLNATTLVLIQLWINFFLCGPRKARKSGG